MNKTRVYQRQNLSQHKKIWNLQYVLKIIPAAARTNNKANEKFFRKTEKIRVLTHYKRKCFKAKKIKIFSLTMI